MSETTRREFVRLSAAGLGACWLAGGCGEAETGWRPRLTERALGAEGVDLSATLGSFFGEDRLEAVRAAGRAYMRRFEPDPDALSADLREAVALVAGATELAPPDRVLEVAIRTDFETPDLVSVAGWQLSRTEARLAALAEVLDVSGP